MKQIATILYIIGIGLTAQAQEAPQARMEWTADGRLDLAWTQRLDERLPREYSLWLTPMLCNGEDTLRFAPEVIRGKLNRKRWERALRLSGTPEEELPALRTSETAPAYDTDSRTISWRRTVSPEPWMKRGAVDFCVEAEKEGCCDVTPLPTQKLGRTAYVPPFVPWLTLVPEGGVASELAKRYPVLHHVSEYEPYDPKKPVSKARGALYVHFPMDVHEVLRDNAANFRKVRFGCIDTGVRAPNIMSVTFADEQAAFLAGAAAALTARSGVLPGGFTGEAIGWLSGESTPMDDSMFSAYAEGARLISPEIRVIRRDAGSFTDEAAAAGQADGLMDEGTAVVAVMARRADNAAVKRIAARGGYLVGETSRALLPERTVTSIVRRLDLAVFEIVAAAAEGRFAGGKIITRTLEDGGVVLTPPEAFARHSGLAVPQRVFSRLEELRRELASGNIRLQSRRVPTLCDCY